jgi:glycosyltransferase involved in cell wall biosynthesis
LNVAFIAPGSLRTPTGGYVYDRHIVEALRSKHTVEVIEVPPDTPGVVATPHAARRLSRGGFDAVVQDGLCGRHLLALNCLIGRSAELVGVVHLLAKDDPRRGTVSEATEASYLRTLDSCVYTSVATRRSSGSDADSVVAHPSSRFSPDVTEDEVWERSRRDGLRVAFVGDVSPVKRLDRLVRAVSSVPGCRVTVAGRSPDRRYARRVKRLCSSLGVEDRVEFVGVLDTPSMASLLRDSDVVAVPSEHESFGTAYIEGMSFGLPAVGPVSGGAREVIEHRRNGFLVGDEKDLLEALSTLAGSPEVLGRMGVEALRTERGWVSWDETGKKVLEHIEGRVER